MSCVTTGRAEARKKDTNEDGGHRNDLRKYSLLRGTGTCSCFEGTWSAPGARSVDNVYNALHIETFLELMHVQNDISSTLLPRSNAVLVFHGSAGLFGAQ